MQTLRLTVVGLRSAAVAATVAEAGRMARPFSVFHNEVLTENKCGITMKKNQSTENPDFIVRVYI